jgi:hypothetical protein
MSHSLSSTFDCDPDSDAELEFAGKPKPRILAMVDY